MTFYKKNDIIIITKKEREVFDYEKFNFCFGEWCNRKYPEGSPGKRQALYNEMHTDCMPGNQAHREAESGKNKNLKSETATTFLKKSPKKMAIFFTHRA